MAVEPRLADKEFETAAKLHRNGIHHLAHAVEIARRIARGMRHAGRRAILAIDVAQRRTPFACGDARFRTGNGWLHDVAAILCRGAQISKGGFHRLTVARLAPLLQRRDLLRLDTLIDDMNGASTSRER